MELYKQGEHYTLYNGSMLELNNVIADNSIDSIVCDPPYELGFMGKSWDSSGIAFNPDTWKICYNALKSGGYLLAFGGSRTYHRIACAIEDAGFEIRDTIMWIYGSGFPKSMNIGLAIDKKNGVESKIKAQNEWDGWGTTLKPAFEPIIVARKPCEGSTTDNVLKYGVGGINIDECRIPTTDYLYNHGNSKGTINSFSVGNFKKAIKGENASTELGRFPANLILTYDESDYDEVCGGFPVGGNAVYDKYNGVKPFEAYDDEGSASRYFYCAKASKRDRDEGLDSFPTQTKVFNGKSDMSSKDIKDVEKRFTTEGKNVHPTVKPTDLMEYLVRLVTPKGGTVLDPFNGSGSTGKAVLYENLDRDKDYKYIGIELEREYCGISVARLDYVEQLLKQPKQLSLFDTLTT